MAQAVLCAVFCMSETNNGMTNDCLENLFRLHVVVCSGGSFSLGCGLSYVAWAQGRHVTADVRADHVYFLDAVAGYRKVVSS